MPTHPNVNPALLRRRSIQDRKLTAQELTGILSVSMRKIDRVIGVSLSTAWKQRGLNPRGNGNTACEASVTVPLKLALPNWLNTKAGKKRQHSKTAASNNLFIAHPRQRICAIIFFKGICAVQLMLRMRAVRGIRLGTLEAQIHTFLFYRAKAYMKKVFTESWPIQYFGYLAKKYVDVEVSLKNCFSVKTFALFFKHLFES
jgi:hypothetical protein